MKSSSVRRCGCTPAASGRCCAIEDATMDNEGCGEGLVGWEGYVRA